MATYWKIAIFSVIVTLGLSSLAVAEAPEAPKPLLRAWLSEQKSLCKTGKTIFKPGHVVERDVNKDGIKDFILDIGFLEVSAR